MDTNDDGITLLENNDVITIKMVDLVKKDIRWNSVIKLFRLICTTPTNKHNHSPEEIQEWKDSQAYPTSFEKIDSDEKDSTKRISLIMNEIPDINGWFYGSKCMNLSFLHGMDFVYHSLKQKLEEIFSSSVQFRGLYFYPPGSYHKWHSNKYDPHGWRIYLVGIPDGGDSSFYYIGKDDGVLYERKDQDLILNLFKVGSEETTGTLYHSVVSRTANRWSFGILVDDDKVEFFLKENFYYM